MILIIIVVIRVWVHFDSLSATGGKSILELEEPSNCHFSRLMTDKSINEQRKSSRVKREIKPIPVSVVPVPVPESESEAGEEQITVVEGSLSPLNSGPWSNVEFLALLKALKKFKWSEWAEMASIVKTRSIEQITSKAYNFTSKAPTEKWSQVQHDLHEIAIKVQLQS